MFKKKKKARSPQSQACLRCVYLCLVLFMKSYILINIKQTPCPFCETDETELQYIHLQKENFSCYGEGGGSSQNGGESKHCASFLP